MFVRPEVVPPTVVLAQRQKQLLDAPRRFALYADAVIKPLAQGRADVTINVALGAHKRPTDWQTPRQRAWWFVEGRLRWKGRKPKQGWKITVSAHSDGGEVVASNAMPGAKYVFNPRYQQRFHKGIWLDTETYRQRELVPLRRDVLEGWGTVNRMGAR